MPASNRSYLKRLRAELIAQMVHGHEDEPGVQQQAERIADERIAEWREARTRPRIVGDYESAMILTEGGKLTGEQAIDAALAREKARKSEGNRE